MDYLTQLLYSESHVITSKYEDTIINSFHEEKTDKQRYDILINLPEYHKKISKASRRTSWNFSNKNYQLMFN